MFLYWMASIHSIVWVVLVAWRQLLHLYHASQPTVKIKTKPTDRSIEKKVFCQWRHLKTSMKQDWKKLLSNPYHLESVELKYAVTIRIRCTLDMRKNAVFHLKFSSWPQPFRGLRADFDLQFKLKLRISTYCRVYWMQRKWEWAMFLYEVKLREGSSRLNPLTDSRRHDSVIVT